MDFKDVERQTEKRLSKIVVGELNMANEELFEVIVREHMFKNELPWEICEESKPLC